ncbi:unnamed protein product [Darwinula stevensoni]|uniref:Ankyrin repeat domain-containing protein n=1 Tax=Darwinula stevensoni TaxID=69355 RepID=A0A7R8X3J1_9CRUS|nr:unnamed protein product [Darwinula stevensoni]CAG0882410.1 unnamed protein product [Darwinula stevensoni]
MHPSKGEGTGEMQYEYDAKPMSSNEDPLLIFMDKIEQKDPRGRTPLMLAVTLGHLESAKVLLEHNANVNIENDEVVQEANATGDPELLMVVLESRNAQRFQTRSQGIPQLLRKLKEAPDFYVEMKWEFTTWVPLLSRICPSDTYKVYKEGSNVRIDTTLLGFEQNKWVRGNKSFIFKGRRESLHFTIKDTLNGDNPKDFLFTYSVSDDGAQLLEVDHDRREVYSVDLGIRELEGEMMPTQDAVEGRLSSPIVTTYVNTDKISFERNKSGIWGWRSDRCETINGHLCKVFSATNVELVTRTRMEHMTEDEKQRCREEEKDSLQLIAPLQTLLGILETSTVNEHEADENVSRRKIF